MRKRWQGALLGVLLGVLAGGAYLWLSAPSFRAPRASTGGPARFDPPSREERLAAVEPLAGLPAPFQRLLDPGDDYPPIPAPGPGDWLERFEEPRQDFATYRQESFLRPAGARRTLYLQPIGPFEGDGAPSLEALADYARAVFQLPVRTLPALDPGALGITHRWNPGTGLEQFLAPELLDALKARLPEDAFCSLGLTLVDLYPEPSWNFVFGLASFTDRVGVFSFARHDPAFFGLPRGPDHARQLMRRSLSVLAHETGHVFGLGHCVYYACLMNGSNSLDEADRQPLHLCPVCLRKLVHNVGFDPVAQHRELQAFYARHGLEPEAAFLARRLAKTGAP